jgi:hypothetical protein
MQLIRKVGLIILGFVLLAAASWKVAEIFAAREAQEKKQQIEDESKREKAEQKESLRQGEAKRSAYTDLISKAAFGTLWTISRTEFDAVDFEAQKQRLITLYQTQPSKLDDGHLASVWTEIHRYAARGLLVLYRIDSLQPKLPAGWDVIHSVQKESDSKTWWRRLANQMDIQQLQSQFRETEANLNRSIGELQSTISKLSLPNYGEKLKIAYLPSWRGALPGDTLQVTNGAGIELQNVLVFVTMTAKTGATLVHLHYAESWKPDSMLTAQYLYGSGDYVNSQSLDQIERLEILAMAPSGLYRGNYEVTQQDWDTRAREYLSKATFQSEYLAPYVEQDTNRHVGPGFQFSFTGLRSLPVRSAKVRFTKGTQFEDTPWNLSTVEAGKPYQLRAISPSEPGTAELTLWFQDTNVIVTLPAAAPAKTATEP